MHMPWGVIALPPNEDVPATPKFAHPIFTLPCVVTPVKLPIKCTVSLTAMLILTIDATKPLVGLIILFAVFFSTTSNAWNLHDKGGELGSGVSQSVLH